MDIKVVFRLEAVAAPPRLRWSYVTKPFYKNTSSYFICTFERVVKVVTPLVLILTTKCREATKTTRKKT